MQKVPEWSWLWLVDLIWSSDKSLIVACASG
jgi:hypothetical protein